MADQKLDHPFEADFLDVNGKITEPWKLTLQTVINSHRRFITSSMTLTGDTTFDSGNVIDFAPGGMIDVAGYDLTINGVVTAGLWQIFMDSVGTGSVSFAGGVTGGVVYPEWFGAVGDGTTDDATAMQWCFDCAGQNTTVLLTNSYLIGSELSITTAGFTLRGASTGGSYFTSDSRANLHLICDFSEKTDALIFIDSLNGGMAFIDHVNIDMANKETQGIRNSTKVENADRAKMEITYCSVKRCGWHGIVVNVGGNASKIMHNFISGPDGFIVDDVYQNDVVETDSTGIYVDAADVWVVGNEVQAAFNYGVKVLRSNGHVLDNFIDQNFTGIYSEAIRTSFVGNRMQYNLYYGFHQDAITAGGIHRNTIVGNCIFRTNLLRSATTGTYSGIGMYLEKSTNDVISGNVFTMQKYGIVIGDVEGTKIVNNSYYDIDTADYDYSSGTGSSVFYIVEGNYNYRITGSTLTSGIDMQNSGMVITGGMQTSTAPTVGINKYINPMTVDTSHSVLTGGNLIKVNCTAASKTLTLTDTDNYILDGALVVVFNSGTEDFTLACTDNGIDGTTTIVSGESYSYYLKTNGEMVEFPQRSLQTRGSGINAYFSMAGNLSKSVYSDANFLNVGCTASGYTLSLSDTNHNLMAGAIVIIYNSGSQTFTLAVSDSGTSIVGTTSILANKVHSYYLLDAGNMIEFPQ